MKIWRLVSGILSIILSVLVFFQSGIAGLSNAMENNGEIGGTAGIVVAILLLTVGIISIVFRNANSKGGSIAIIMLCAIAALAGFAGAGSYSDLKIWSAWCVIILIMAIVSMVANKKENIK